MSSVLADANLCIRGHPAHKCLLPGEAHNENSKNKGIGVLTQKEIVTLIDALKGGTMQVLKVDKAHRGEFCLPFTIHFRVLTSRVVAVMASERPVITGIAPPPEWPHEGARRLFANGDTDYHGPVHLQPNSAATKVKKEKAPQAPLPPSDNDNNNNNDSGDDHPAVPAAPKLRKHTMRVELPPPLPLRPFKVVAAPCSRPVKIVQKPEPTAAVSEVISITLTEDVEEPDTEYEEAHGKKRNLKAKATNTSHASKRQVSSEEKTDTSKVGKKGSRTQTKPPKALPLPSTSPTKGGPLSPLTVGSSSVAGSPEPESEHTLFSLDFV
jgi:hypothetical protein